MALRYWVGGSGTWDTTSTTNWSATFTSLTASCSGTTLTVSFGTPVVGQTVWSSNYTSLGTVVSGSGTTWVVSVGGTYAGQAMSMGTAGASVPTAADSVGIIGTSARTVTLTGALACASLVVGGTSQTLATGTTPTLSIVTTLNVGAGSTWSMTGAVTFTGTSGTGLITTSGVTINSPITFNGAGGTWQLQDALTTATARSVTLTAGTLDLNGKTLTTGSFASSGANTRVIAFGTGNITVTGTGTVWNTTFVTNLTTTGTQVVNVSNSGAVAVTVTSGVLAEAYCISFNFTAGTYTLTTTTGNTFRNLNFTGFAGTVANTLKNVFGSFTAMATASSGTFSGGTNSLTFMSTSATPQTITTNGKLLDFPIAFNGPGSTYVLQDALTMGGTRTLTHYYGTLDLNGKTLTVGTSYATNTGTKVLKFNGGTLVCPASGSLAFNNAVPTGFTTVAGTGTGYISMTGAASKTFTGGGSAFNCVLRQSGLGTLTIAGSNTFSDITNTVQPTTITFTAGTTNTFSNFSLSGTAGNLVTINSSTAGTQASVSKSGGIVSCDYLSIQDSAAGGGATWYAGANSTNVSNNTGWIFSAPPVPGIGNFFTFLTN